jgi:Protein of unknown function DUF262
MSTIKTKRIDYKMQYDPNDVDIRLEHFTVEEVIKLIENGILEIIEENDLQRLPDSWDLRRKSLLIESLLIKLPLPIFYLDGSQEIWQVIDGLQRLTTLYQYISPKSEKRFQLKQLEYLKEEYGGFSFDELPLSMRRRILDSTIEAFVLNPGTPLPVKYNIFQRINTLGLKLKAQEIRNALYRGIPSNFTKELASEEIFKIATNGKVNGQRMDDREYATRFVAFQWFKDDYGGDIDDFLRRTMEEMNQTKKDERDSLKRLFLLSLSRAHSLFGNHCFYRIEPDLKPRGRTPNKALYDTLSWNFSKLSNVEFDKLKAKRNSFFKQYVKFINGNTIFFKAIDNTTGSKTSITNRFNLLETFFKEQL